MGTSQIAHRLATTPVDTAPRWVKSWHRGLVSVAAAALLLWLTFRTLDAKAVEERLRAGGPWLLLVLLAYLVPVGTDTIGWRWLLARLGHIVPLRRLLSVRLSAEALNMSLPGGAVLAESATPAMLRTRCRVPLSDGVASLAARKCLLGLGQATAIVAAASLGGATIAAAARALHLPSLRGLFWATAALIALVTIGAARLLTGASVGARLKRALHVLPVARLRRYLEERQTAFDRFDAGAARLLRSRDTFAAVPIFALVWLAEAGETWLLLALLGSPLTFTQALPIEATASVLRLSAIVVPAGLGVQEVGYVALIAATGAANAKTLAAAFAVVKRLKEAFWTWIGYGLLARFRP